MNATLHLGQSLVLGCLLGFFYGFLRPFRPRWLGDLAFIAALFWVWIYLIFGLCQADPRMAYTLFLLAGIFLWEATAGVFLGPVFSLFWELISRIFCFFWGAFKNTWKKAGKIINFLFARSKKWVTIKCNQHPST